MRQPTRRHLGRILLDGGFLSQHDLDGALEEHNNTKEMLGQVLVKRGVLKVKDIKVPLIIQEHLGTIDKAVKIVAGERQLLGELLVQSGHITDRQLDQIIAEQQRCSEKIGEIFKRLGVLNEQQLNALLDFQLNQEVALHSPLRLGEILVATGHLDREQLEVALHQQKLSNKKLGEVLVEAGFVTSSHIEYGIGLQKMLQKAVLVAILSLGMSTEGQIVDNTYAADEGTCLFSKQLQNSPMREQFIAKLAMDTGTLIAHNTTTGKELQSDASDELFSPVESFGGKSSSFNQGDSIDSYSKNCLSCHDGSAASDRNVSYKNNPDKKNHSYDGTQEHPIGMNYAAYVAANPTGYKPISAFNSKMIFIKGKVGCLSCHYPLNPEKNHLVMSDFQSALCLTCHNKGS
ncbi:MAG: hypothetical protein JJE30_16335 [Desulfuromonadales bacterium]|nr:hypothetical protein [Desulfuromonadales bacterium]